MKSNLSRFFQSRWNVMLFRHVHPLILQGYIQFLGRIYYLFKRKEKLLIEKNIRDFLYGKTEREIRKITREAFRGIFLHYFEKMFSAYRSFPEVSRYVERHFQVKNLEVIEKALKKGKGLIVATAHFGAVEFIPWVLALNGFPVSVILEFNTDVLKKVLEEKVKIKNVELISESDGRGSVFFRALKSLKNGRILMTECDEVDKWHRRKSSTIQLFGKTLYFDDTLNILSKRTGAPVVGVFLKRMGKNSYTLICEDVSVEKPVDNTAKNVFYLWQKYVTESPEQWYQWKKWANMKVAS